MFVSVTCVGAAVQDGDPPAVLQPLHLVQHELQPRQLRHLLPALQPDRGLTRRQPAWLQWLVPA